MDLKIFFSYMKIKGNVSIKYFYHFRLAPSPLNKKAGPGLPPSPPPLFGQRLFSLELIALQCFLRSYRLSLLTI